MQGDARGAGKEADLEYFPESYGVYALAGFSGRRLWPEIYWATAMSSQKYSVGHMDHYFAKLLLLLQEVKCRNALV